MEHVLELSEIRALNSPELGAHPAQGLSVRRRSVEVAPGGDGREFVLWVELGPDDERTIARVEGIDPTNPSEDSLAE